MTQPLHTKIYVTAVIITIIMGGVILMGSRQYQLRKHQEQVISRSEEMLFRFSMIREHLVEALVSHRVDALPAIADEVESFHTHMTQLMDNVGVSGEFKLNLMAQADLPDFILLLRNAGPQELDQETRERMNRESRILLNRLMVYNQALVDDAKSRFIAFQNLTIGALAIVLFITINLLVMGHRSIATPLLLLLRQVREIGENRRKAISKSLRRGSGEVATLGESFQALIVSREKTISAGVRFNQSLYAAHQAGIAIRNAENREQLLNEIGRTLLLNEDYCLVQIDIPDQQNEGLVPLPTSTAADRKTASCLATFLAESNENGRRQRAAVRAIKEKQPVIDRNILSDIPGEQLKNTKLTDVRIDCVALPLVWQKRIYGVMNIYSDAADCFQEGELKLLGKTADDVAFSLHFLEVKGGTVGGGPINRHTTCMAALGELTSGIAHEINNLSNVIINYAQLITDEVHEDCNPAQMSQALEIIIRKGERIADIAGKLIFYDKEQEQTREIVSLHRVINDAFMLVGHHLKSDGIVLKLDIPAHLPSLPLRVQDFHIALLILINNARRSLNLRFPDKDSAKKLTLSCRQHESDEKRYIRMELIDHGAGLSPETISRIFAVNKERRIPDNEIRHSLSVCRDLVETELKGVFILESVSNDHTTATIDLPIQL